MAESEPKLSPLTEADIPPIQVPRSFMDLLPHLSGPELKVLLALWAEDVPPGREDRDTQTGLRAVPALLLAELTGLDYETVVATADQLTERGAMFSYRRNGFGSDLPSYLLRWGEDQVPLE